MPGRLHPIARSDQLQNEHLEASGAVGLAITQNESDLALLRHMFDDAGWTLYQAHSYREAMFQLNRDRVHVILCERQLADGSWKDVLSHLAPWVERPRLIVIANGADERLWSEVLAMGGFDLLATPLKESEVAYLVGSAWLDWQNEHTHAKKGVSITGSW